MRQKLGCEGGVCLGLFLLDAKHREGGEQPKLCPFLIYLACNCINLACCVCLGPILYVL